MAFIKKTKKVHKPLFSGEAWKYYYRFFREDRWKLVFTSVGFVGLTYLIIPTLMLVKYTFDTVIPQKQIHMFIWVGLAILGIRILNSTLTLLLRNSNIRTITAAIQKMRENLTQKVFMLSRSYFTREDLGVLHTQIVQDTERVNRMGNTLIAGAIPSLLNSIGMIAVLLYLNWYLFLIIMLFFPVLYFSGKHMGRIAKRKVYDYQRAFEGFSKGTLFLVKFMDLIKLQSVEDEEGEKHISTLNNLRKKTTTRAFFNALNNQFQNIVIGLIGLLILVIGGISVIKNRMTLGDLMAFYLAANQLQSKLNNLSNSFTTLLTGNESLVTLLNIAGHTDLEPYGGKTQIRFDGHIRFSDVTFGYEPHKIVIRNVSFEILPGSRTAIVGANGAGKSTIINLLLGFYKPLSGRILAEGIEYTDIDFRHFRKHIGVVTQHPPLIPGTIGQNILYGNSHATDDDVKEVSHLSLADAFINQLPGGYDTQIGENGVLLSGGERQKIAIARALLRKPGLLILDEPTNHLDNLAVKEIMRNIGELRYNPAILIISHDMEVVKHAQEIFMIENGNLFPYNIENITAKQQKTNP